MLAAEDKPIFFAQWISEVLQLVGVLLLEPPLLHHQRRSSIPPLDDVLAVHFIPASAPLLGE